MRRPRVVSINLLTEVLCAGGLVLANGVPFDTSRPPRLLERIDGYWVTRRLTMGVAPDWADRTLLATGRVLEVNLDTDGDGQTDLSIEVRIARVIDTEPDGAIQVEAHGIERDLRKRNQEIPALPEGLGGVSPATMLTALAVANGPSYIVLGPVTPTGAVTMGPRAAGGMAWDGASDTAKIVEEQLGARYELELLRNGTTNYQLCLRVAGATATSPDIRSRKNLIRMVRTRELEGQATRVSVVDRVGANLLATPCYEVSAVSAGAHIEILDLAGGQGAAQQADQLNGLAVVDDGGTLHTITDTVVISSAVSRLLMASTTGLSVGELVKLRLASGAAIRHLDSPLHQALYGILLQPLRSVLDDALTNVLGRNTDAHDWPGAVPEDWTSFGTGTISKDTGVFLVGGQSIKLTSTVAPWAIGVYKQKVYHSEVGEDVVLSVWFRLPNVVGSQLTLRAFVDGGEVSGSPETAVVGTYAPDVWHRFDWVTSVAAGAHTYKVQVNQANVTGGHYGWVSGVQVLVGTDQILPFRLGSPGARAIQRANAYFAANGHAVASYRCEIADLGRALPQHYPFDGFTLGGTMAVRATGLDVSIAPRAMSLDRNLLNPADTAVDLNVWRPDFVGLTAQG